MSGGQMETPARREPQPGQDGRLANAAGTLPIAQANGRAKRSGLYHVTPDRLTTRQADFVATAARLLTTGRALTPKQANWLRDLHVMLATRKEH